MRQNRPIRKTDPLALRGVLLLGSEKLLLSLREFLPSPPRTRPSSTTNGFFHGGEYHERFTAFP